MTQRRNHALDGVLEIMHASILGRNSIGEGGLVGVEDSLLVIFQHEKVKNVVLDGL